ncbi:MAG: serine hydrolase [Lachnospiraceae bacterium]|nr:serine hydrolase [Lachnospiraceae bacterium]
MLVPDGKESDATIRSILNHTSGIIDGEDSFYGLRRNDPEVGLLDVLEGRTPYNKRRASSEKQPGTEFEYSDAGYCVLQLMIQEVTASGFEEIAAGYVFEQGICAGNDKADRELFVGRPRPVPAGRRYAGVAGLGRKRTEYVKNEFCVRRDFCCDDKHGSRC